MTAAQNGWVIGYDNLSGFPSWLADGLCRLSTGGRFHTRTLYSDDEETIFDAQRPVILNGIDQISSRHDLLDRSIIITLPPIQDQLRRHEGEFWADFNQAKPQILGALYDAVSMALRNLPNTNLDRLPRMADFALWVTAAEAALPWPQGGFMEAYTGNRANTISIALDADLVATAIRRFIEGCNEREGTPSDLLTKLCAITDERLQRTDAWPKKPNTLTRRLRRCATLLRTVDVEMDLDHRDVTPQRTRLIKIGKVQRNIAHIVQPSNDTREPAENDNSSLDDILDNIVQISSSRESACIESLGDMDGMDDKDPSLSVWHKQRQTREI
jgi:hypothetical protein